MLKVLFFSFRGITHKLNLWLQKENVGRAHVHPQTPPLQSSNFNDVPGDWAGGEEGVGVWVRADFIARLQLHCFRLVVTATQWVSEGGQGPGSAGF